MFPREDIFPQQCSNTSQVKYFDDDFIQFYDEPKTAINFQAKADDNLEDELLKLIDEAIYRIEL